MRAPSFLLPVFLLLASFAGAMGAPAREHASFDANWRFHQGDPAGSGDGLDYAKIKPWLLAGTNAFTRLPAPAPDGALTTDATFARTDFDDAGWRKLDLPHDWGIEGPFKQELPGDTGKRSWWGVAWYRKSFDLPASDAGRRVCLEIEGAMSYATVWCNGRFVGGWPYGYASWQVDLTAFLKPGARNVVAIRLDNPPDSSRWYPGGGLYRHVWLTKTAPVHVAPWGTTVTTPQAAPDGARVKVETIVANDGDGDAPVEVQTQLFTLAIKDGAETRETAGASETVKLTVPASRSGTTAQEIAVGKPRLWNLDAPNLYVALTRITKDGVVVDEHETTFGIRRIEFTADRGFLLNGQRVQLKGVCNHHDLGALGAAFNRRAAERQLEILKEMGCNALRTSHNPPAPELLDLCDRMGILVMDESFDCWQEGKTDNDYARLFNDWSERDLRAEIRRDRNHPSVILWSVGNEIVNVESPANAETAKRLVGIVHEEDATRPATAAVNNTPVAYNGYQNIFDVFGFNYRQMEYARFHEKNPAVPVFGSETASTVSSRGEYVFPVVPGRTGGLGAFQVSGYDLYAPRWAWPPDAEFKSLDQTPAALGEFVWTGFDYLGEPTPFGDGWDDRAILADPADREGVKQALQAAGLPSPPSRSSYFGIVDLAGFRKDRFYLYQARWRPDYRMAHILPHWTWPGREGQVTPVHVYSSGDEAELFLNGKSLGKKKRPPGEYRFRWDDVRYEPGELVVEVQKDGKRWARDSVQTAGTATRLDAAADRTWLGSDGADLSYVTITVTDANGVTVPQADSLIRFEVGGPGDLVATDNGDATDLAPFQARQRRAFHGQALAIVRTRPGIAGEITVRASVDGLKSASVVLTVADGQAKGTPPVRLDPAKTQGVWEGWGTSLCWMGKVFGGRDDLADALFTTREDVPLAGQTLPGLGLNIVRYNAGACSPGEVDGRRIALSPNIRPWKQMEGFWLDGKSDDPQSASWDWSVDANQRAMLLKARERGADRFELFSNSPPWWLCANQNPSGAAEAVGDNLPPENYARFALYLATVAKEARERWGIDFTTVEPFNESQSNFWQADGRQEGCHFTRPAQAAVLRLLRAGLDTRGLQRMPIAASDESWYDWAVGTWNSFDAGTKDLVAQVNVHGYQGGRGRRDLLREITAGKRLWNTEYGDDSADGMSLARNLSQDFAELRPTAWCYWQPLDGSAGWALVPADIKNATIGTANPKYFVLAQYSRHIRPGMTILDTGDKETVAARDPKTGRIVIVALNAGSQPRDRVCDLSRLGVADGPARSWLTQTKGGANHQRQPDTKIEESRLTVSLPPLSVQTFELEGAATP